MLSRRKTYGRASGSASLQGFDWKGRASYFIRSQEVGVSLEIWEEIVHYSSSGLPPSGEAGDTGTDPS